MKIFTREHLKFFTFFFLISTIDVKQLFNFWHSYSVILIVIDDNEENSSFVFISTLFSGCCTFPNLLISSQYF